MRLRAEELHGRTFMNVREVGRLLVPVPACRNQACVEPGRNSAPCSWELHRGVVRPPNCGAPVSPDPADTSSGPKGAPLRCKQLRPVGWPVRSTGEGLPDGLRLPYRPVSAVKRHHKAGSCPYRCGEGRGKGDGADR
jgi:hypothetical protein